MEEYSIHELLTREDIMEWAFSLDEPQKKTKLDNQVPQISSSATINRAQFENMYKKKYPSKNSSSLILQLKSQNKQLREMIRLNTEVYEQLQKQIN